jgi:hypothetical protein
MFWIELTASWMEPIGGVVAADDHVIGAEDVAHARAAKS